MKLDAEEKRIWLEALRSGEFRQARGLLFDRDTGGFCCLGVYLHKVKGLQPNTDPSKTRECFVGIGLYLDWLNHLPNALRTPAWDLARMNDNEGKSFVEIADWIDANL